MNKALLIFAPTLAACLLCAAAPPPQETAPGKSPDYDSPNSPDSPDSPRSPQMLKPRHTNDTRSQLPYAESICCLERYDPNFVNYSALNDTLFNHTFGNYTCEATSLCANDTARFIHEVCAALFPRNFSVNATNATNCTVSDNRPGSGKLLRCILTTPRAYVNWSAVIYSLPDLFRLRLTHWETRIDRLLDVLRKLLPYWRHGDEDSDSPRGGPKCTTITTSSTTTTTITTTSTSTSTLASAPTTTTNTSFANATLLIL